MNRSKLTLIIIASIVIVGGGIVALLSSTNNDKSNTQTNDAQTNNTSTPADTNTPSNAPIDDASQIDTDNDVNTAENTETNSTTASPENNAQPSAPTPTSHNISYTNNCYTPVNITIKKDDTIIFTNNSNRDMWPASKNHPSHKEYPDFDAKNGITSGGTYQFTFSNTGSWGYHDHEKPSCTGTITVQ